MLSCCLLRFRWEYISTIGWYRFFTWLLIFLWLSSLLEWFIWLFILFLLLAILFLIVKNSSDWTILSTTQGYIRFWITCSWVKCFFLRFCLVSRISNWWLIRVPLILLFWILLTFLFFLLFFRLPLRFISSKWSPTLLFLASILFPWFKRLRLTNFWPSRLLSLFKLSHILSLFTSSFAPLLRILFKITSKRSPSLLVLFISFDRLELSLNFWLLYLPFILRCSFLLRLFLLLSLLLISWSQRFKR